MPGWTSAASPGGQTTDTGCKSILTCWLRTSFCASSTNRKDLFLLSPRLQINSGSCGTTAPRGRRLGTQETSQNQQQKSHTGRASLLGSLPPGGSWIWCDLHASMSYTADYQVLGVICKVLQESSTNVTYSRIIHVPVRVPSGNRCHNQMRQFEILIMRLFTKVWAGCRNKTQVLPQS